MALRGIQPKEIKKRLKLMLFGVTSTGKTMGALGFPAPYVIDAESGIQNPQYVHLAEKMGGVVCATRDFSIVMTELRALIVDKHPYKTLVIDPITNIYDDLLDESKRRILKKDPDKDPTAYGRHYSWANNEFKRLLALLLELDMNVIITAHSKTQYNSDMNVIGETFDCYKKLDYIFDLVIEIQKLGKTRLGIVRKSRITTFPEYDEFDFSYDAIAQRYDAAIMEKPSVPIATPEQISEAADIIKARQIPVETVKMWLKKDGYVKFKEMDTTVIAEWINRLQTWSPETQTEQNIKEQA